jgi:puromycin-sensitive aminopeptidase
MCNICEGGGTSHAHTHDFRLGDNVVPSHYQLYLKPDCDTFATLEGVAEIDVTVKRPTRAVTLHAHGLQIIDAYAVSALNGCRIGARKSMIYQNHAFPKPRLVSAARIDNEHDQQFATFQFEDELWAGEWKLVVEYEALTIQPTLEGCYRSEWTDANGEKKFLLSTQFEDIHARRAFPCFDEPPFKATFKLMIEVRKHLTALSGGRIISEQDLGNGNKLVTFTTTPIQSTYLVAWAVGELESSRSVWVNGVEIRVWSVPGKNHLKEFALKCAEFGIPWYEKRLDVKYFGGDKLDLIAIPVFRSGAMENTGLLTFREPYLLVDMTTATLAELKRLAMVIFHEIAHQWFGNLVTMKWWDGLPLNESNATFFGWLVLQDFMPHLNAMDDFALERDRAYALDALKSTHKCWMPIGHPSEVRQIFDLITYNKGGALELWLLYVLSPQVFFCGMHIYLTRFAYGNADVTDLWDCLQEGARLCGIDLPVRQIMDSWFLTPGHPVVTVSEYGQRHINLTQERFLLQGEDATSFWPIMVDLRIGHADGTVTTETFVFATAEKLVYVGDDWRFVVVNQRGDGFYRVRYSKMLLDRLIESGLSKLNVVERFNLVNDSWALVRAHKLDCESFVSLLPKLKGEDNPIVWTAISNSLSELYRLTPEGQRGAFRQLIGDLARPMFDRLGWTASQDDSAAALELRGRLAILLGTIGEDRDVQLAAVDLFDAWKGDPTSVHPEVAAALVKIIAYTGDEDAFEDFVDRSRSAPTVQEKLRFLGGLGYFREPWLLARAIKMMIEEVKVDDAPFILRNFMDIEPATVPTWKALVADWEKVVARFPQDTIPRMIEFFSNLDTPELAGQVRDFFAHHKLAGGEMATAQMLERLAINERLRESAAPALASLLTARASGGHAAREIA